MMRIALPRGEWAKPTEEYLASVGFPFEINGDQQFVREFNTRHYPVQFRLTRATDVPYLVNNGMFSYMPEVLSRYWYGITGIDIFDEARMRGSGNIKILEQFDGKDKTGRLVLYARKRQLPRNPRIVVKQDYRELATKYCNDLLGENGYSIGLVDGSDEGYVTSGEADAGFGLTVSGKTLKREKLVVLNVFMEPVYPVLISRDSTAADFRRLLKQLKRK